MTLLRAAALLLPVLAACGPAPPPGTPDSEASYTRIVTLAPSLAELVFAAGAGDKLVGVSAWSTFPPEVQALPLVGDAFTVDQERLALLRPDLLLAWRSGTPEHVADELGEAGYNVVMIRTQTLQEISAALRTIGALAGTSAHARAAADAFDAELHALAAAHAGKDPVRVFYQVSARPLYTINGDHYISELIHLCGGENVFAELADLAPAIDVEAVIDRDPELLLASRDAGVDALAIWDRWPEMTANRRGNRVLVADELGRPTTAVVGAAVELCAALDEARARRTQPGTGRGT